MDTNFDALADRLAHRVYGGLKGQLRLAVIWRDLLPLLEAAEQRFGQLTILDVGGGLAQISQRLAERGHNVLYNDLSQRMFEQAVAAVKAAGVAQRFSWHKGSYDSLQLNPESFDIILCHALLEWLAEPAKLLPALRPALKPGGLLSLCYYNPAGKVYRNLIRGNFDMLNNQAEYESDGGSLTPNYPCERNTVLAWLADTSLQVVEESGIRVFHDYVVERRGGHQNEQQVLEMELRYSKLEPYKWLGRYQHIVARAVDVLQ